MTITFKCPNCDQLCAFHEKHSGRRARCTNCQQAFTIPDRESDKAVKIKTEPDAPLPGFYRSALKDNWKMFTDIKNITGFAFVTALVCFRFFLRHVDYSFTPGRAQRGFRVQLPIGWIVIIITWGCQCWYYMETIYAGSLNMEELPEIEIGFGFEFFWNVFKSLYLFFVAIIIAEIPFLLIAGVLRKIGIDWEWLLQILTLTGALFFPVIILILSTGRELWLVFRFDYTLRILVKGFRPYSIIAGLVIAAAIFQWETVGFDAVQYKPYWQIAIALAVNLAAACFTLFAMRAIGLFARHYQCYMPR